MKFVTIDSNVYNITKLIAKKLNNLPELSIPVTRWCTKLNRCSDVDNNSGSWPNPSSKSKETQIYYNTPVSMSDDITYYNMPENALHFVYVDFGTNTTDLKRILKNIKHLKNVVVLSNASVYPTGQYKLYPGNCTDDAIAETICTIIVMHTKESRPIHEKEIISLICQKTKYSPSEKEQCEAKKYDIYNIMDSKRSVCGEISDCYECST